VAAQPAHYQAGIHAYRVALDERKDWHAAVSAAIEAALERKAYDDGKPDAERLPPEERCTCGSPMRPDVVMFGEAVQDLHRAMEEAASAMFYLFSGHQGLYILLPMSQLWQGGPMPAL
jgi:hypothetical protein